MSPLFSEDDVLPISALQHLAFCERQWGLIHLEQIWVENLLTAEGRLFHEQADEQSTEIRGDLMIARGIRLRSLRLGLTGKADIVEFHRKDKNNGKASVDTLTGRGMNPETVSDMWQPFPVEYKRGKPKSDSCDEIQLCAQGLCLEEMLNTSIPEGALFYGKTRRRTDVVFTEMLREDTERFTARLHELYEARVTPPAKYGKKCDRCSLITFCIPKITGGSQSVNRYMESAYESVMNEDNG